MKISRRDLLVAAGAGAFATATGLSHFSARAMSRRPERNALAIPPLLDARAGHHPVELVVTQGTTAFFPGSDSSTLGYNGAYLGPTLRVHRGDEVALAVTNRLATATTVHWHGLVIAGELDGGPHQVIEPGMTWRPTLPIRQAAATLFYHSHVHNATAMQVYRGLAGVLIVADQEEASLGLPSEYGIDDIPLVLQDRQFESGRLVMPNGMMDVMMGRRGDTLLVNGTPDAVARVPSGLVRLRLVNGSNARIYALSFDDSRVFHWIASEGGLLETPVQLKSLSLAPGQRAEILVDFTNGHPVALETSPDLNAPMMGMMRGLSARARDAFGLGRQVVLAFEPESSGAAAKSVPRALVKAANVDAARASRRRKFVLGMGMGGMMSGGMMGGGMGGSGGGIAVINGRPFDMERVDEQVRLGDTEIWEVSGEMMSHPFHVHGVQFRVLRRAGRAPDVADQGARDTILAREPVELLVEFTQPSGHSPFMYHCHILEHEDAGMMGQFTVT